MINPCSSIDSKPDAVGQLVDSFTTQGRVASVYDQAANILIPSGIFVSLVARTRQMTPLSVKFPAAFDCSGSRQSKIKVGAHVQIKPGRMTVGRMRMDLQKAPRFQGIADYKFSEQMDADKINRFHHVLTVVGQPGGLLGLIDPKQDGNPFVRKGRSLCQRIFNDPGPRMAGHLAKFAGLGVGLTPSGDDLLCGFLLGKKICTGSVGNKSQYQHLSMSMPLDEATTAIIWKAANQTTDAGRTLIWLALKGRFPGYLLDAVEGLANARTPADIFKAVSAAVGCGKTSGTDALVGLLLYLQLSHQRSKCAGK